MNVELRLIAHNAKTRGIVEQFDRYRSALGRDPSAYWVDRDQMASINDALEKYNKRDDGGLRLPAEGVCHKGVQVALAKEVA